MLAVFVEEAEAEAEAAVEFGSDSELESLVVCAADEVFSVIDAATEEATCGAAGIGPVVVAVTKTVSLTG